MNEKYVDMFEAIENLPESYESNSGEYTEKPTKARIEETKKFVENLNDQYTLDIHADVMGGIAIYVDLKSDINTLLGNGDVHVWLSFFNDSPPGDFVFLCGAKAGAITGGKLKICGMNRPYLKKIKEIICKGLGVENI